MDMLNTLGLAFLQGLAMYKTPDILPVLIIIIFGSLTGNYKRLLGMAIGFIFMFTGFTASSRYIVENFGLDLDIYRAGVFFLTALFGLLMSCDYLHKKFNHLTQIFVGINENKLSDEYNNFSMGLVLGSLLALAWTPLNSMVVDTIIIQTILHKISIQSYLTLLLFSIGVAIPALLITSLLKVCIARQAWLRTHTHLLHNISGFVIFIGIIFLTHYYSFSAPVFSLNKNGETSYQTKIINGVSQPYAVPDISGIDSWLHTSPLTKTDLQGKVVLLYFWTYSCIHCTHATPYIIDWYNNYKDNGLLIIGVHTPEFEFEKNERNVENAVSSLQIPYPVAVDNKFVTWENFHNKNWPAYYLINKNGDVVYQLVGEGSYTEMENNIRYLLGFNAVADTAGDTENINENSPVLAAGITPETHFGSDHATTYDGPTPLEKDSTHEYSFPGMLKEANWALSGEWIISADKITAAGNDAAIKIRFHSQKVFAIIGAKHNSKTAVKVLLDNKPIPAQFSGTALVNSVMAVDNPRLYEILNLDKARSGELELIMPAGVELYTLSFDDF